MNWQDDYFSPENVDEQVDLASDDIPRLARIRDRLAMRMAADKQEKTPISMQDYRQPGNIEPLTPVQEVPHADSTRKWRRATFVFAGLVAILVLASMLTILTLLKTHPQSTTLVDKPPVGGLSSSSAYYG